ncbi:hypothetical protein VNO77_14531 [Canavalia gladiata]|uniref:Uncharacterized protein n=1 Tax=Canavalia gladiata TaxID=3824 RepID=A0AAN9LZG2_CANGL
MGSPSRWFFFQKFLPKKLSLALSLLGFLPQHFSREFQLLLSSPLVFKNDSIAAARTLVDEVLSNYKILVVVEAAIAKGAKEMMMINRNYRSQHATNEEDTIVASFADRHYKTSVHASEDNYCEKKAISELDLFNYERCTPRSQHHQLTDQRTDGAKVYMEVDKIIDELVIDSENKIPLLLVTINDLNEFGEVPVADYEIRDTLNSVYQNLDMLDSYISFLVIKHRKPRKIIQHWIRYTCGAVDGGSKGINSWLSVSKQKGQNFPENASDQEMLQIVMDRYEKELMHPIQNLFNEELARAMLIQDTKADGRSRVARIQRRLLVVEVEKSILQYKSYLEQGLERYSHCMFGLILYGLDRLYHSVKGHAEASEEWQCL